MHKLISGPCVAAYVFCSGGQRAKFVLQKLELTGCLVLPSQVFSAM